MKHFFLSFFFFSALHCTKTLSGATLQFYSRMQCSTVALPTHEKNSIVACISCVSAHCPSLENVLITLYSQGNK